MVQHTYDSESPVNEDASHDTRRRLNGQMRSLTGPLDEDVLESLEFDVEVETFEPLRSRKATSRKQPRMRP